MARARQLSKKQLAVIEDLFFGELNEGQVLEKHKVSRNVYTKWQRDELFTGEFEVRLAGLRRQSELIIARYTALAAAKLVGLTDSEQGETARKACLDIMSLPKLSGKKSGGVSNSKAGEEKPIEGSFTAAKASRVLAALSKAEGKK
jgi:hypothetical protein